MIKSICIVRLSALGDVMMLVPLVRTLQTCLPDVALTWVISRPAYDLVEGLDGVEFIVIDKPASPADYWRFAKRLKGRRFDVLLATQASFRANLLYSLISADRKIGYDSLRAKDGHGWFVNETIRPGNDHTLEGFLKFSEALGLPEKCLRWDLPVAETDYAFARQHLSGNQPVLLVNPAASKPERSWFADRYAAVIHHAQHQWNAQVILTGGPGAQDRALADAVLGQVSCLDLTGKTKPKQLLALMALADVMLCPDTGPSHMAVAMGTPVLALHAVTSAEVSGPYLSRHRVVDCYPEAIRNVLKKNGAVYAWGTHAHGSEAMTLVTVEAVVSKLDGLMSEILLK